jgi:hypothetical protein
MKEPLQLTGNGYALAVTPEAEALKSTLLRDAAAVVTVDSPETSAAASSTLKDLASFRNTLEKSRKQVKEPILAAGRKIDGLAEEFGSAVAAEEARIKKMIEQFAAEQAKARREAEERARREAAEAERKRQEEERARLAAEEAKRRAEQAEAAQDAEAAAKAKAEAEEAEFNAAIAKLEAEAAAPAAVEYIPTPKAKAVLDFEVTDLAALASDSPELVTITPKRAEILNRIKQLQLEPGSPVIPGIRIFEAFKASTR